MRFSGALCMALMPTILVTTLALSCPAGAQAGTPLFVANEEACFGRVYDRAHLASHPNQTVTSLHIFRSLGERPEHARPPSLAGAASLSRDAVGCARPPGVYVLTAARAAGVPLPPSSS